MGHIFDALAGGVATLRVSGFRLPALGDLEQSVFGPAYFGYDKER
jgi:hypothetical protein